MMRAVPPALVLEWSHSTSTPEIYGKRFAFLHRFSLSRHRCDELMASALLVAALALLIRRPHISRSSERTRRQGRRQGRRRWTDAAAAWPPSGSISRQWRHRWTLSRTRIDQGRSGRRYGRLYVGDGVFCLLGSRHSQLIFSLIRGQAPTLQHPSPALQPPSPNPANPPNLQRPSPTLQHLPPTLQHLPPILQRFPPTLQRPSPTLQRPSPNLQILPKSGRTRCKLLRKTRRDDDGRTLWQLAANYGHIAS
jgi:hypothetical protein